MNSTNIVTVMTLSTRLVSVIYTQESMPLDYVHLCNVMVVIED